MPKMTLAQFGAQVKAKHPEYASYADEEIGQRVLSKYPQYGAQVDAVASPSAEDVVRAAGISTPAAHAPAPRELSGRPGDSTDLRVNLFGNDGSQMLKVPARHAVDAVTGIANAVRHPMDAAAAFLGKGALLPTTQSIRHGDYETRNVDDALRSVPMVGSWAAGIRNDADEYGSVPALLGLGVDALAPKAVGKAGEIATGSAGAAVRVAGSTPESLKLAATRVLVPGSAGEVLQRALKPGVKYGANVEEKLAATLPDAIKARPRINSVADLGEALDQARDANAAEHASTMQPYRGDSPRPLRINGNALMEAQADSVPRLRKFEGAQPSSFATDPNSPYNRWIPAAEADELRMGANQELHSYYNKSGGDRAAAEASPRTARIKSVADGVREQLYPAIEADQGLTPGSIAERQQQYGRLSEVGDIANKREVVAGRHDPVSLPEKLAIEGGHGITSKIQNYALQKLVRGLTDSDALVRSAVDRYQNPNATPLVTAPLPARIGQAATASADALRRLNPFLPLISQAGQSRAY